MVILLIAANGVFAMSEAALISSRRARLQQRADEGDKGAQAALRLSENPTRFLSTVQVGITLIGILSGAFGGAALAAGLAGFLRTIPALAASADALALALVVLFITYLSLIVGELVPKRIALNNPEAITAFVARPMLLLSALAAPVVALLSFSTEIILRLFGLSVSQEPPVTEEEVEFMMEEGTQAGIFEEAEQEIISNLFRTGDRRISSIMTYRADMVWIDLTASPATIYEQIAVSRHLYYPVCEGDVQNFLGVLSVRELLPHLLRGSAADLRRALITPLYIPESRRILQTLDTFQSGGGQVAIVIDEHGDIQGMITVIDIIESIVGDLPEAPGGSAEEPDMVQRADGSWLLDGMVHIDDVAEIFGEGIFPEDEHGSYQTLSGFVMTRIGRIPAIADQFEWNGLRFEIVDMDGRRVDRVLVSTQDARL